MGRPIQELVYSDLDFKFRAHPVTGNLQKQTNVEAVKQAVKNTVMTNRYERLFQPDNYSGVTGALFENVSIVELGFLRNQIIWAIKNYEPRANVIDVVIDEYLDQNGFNVRIYFRVNNILEPVVVDIFLERVR